MHLTDTPSQNIIQHLHETSSFIRSALRSGGKVQRAGPALVPGFITRLAKGHRENAKHVGSDCINACLVCVCVRVLCVYVCVRVFAVVCALLGGQVKSIVTDNSLLD
jgi:hypothetical protein